MTIPTKLITTTIDEFKAEGYECTYVSANSNAIVEGNRDTQTVSMTFAKTEVRND